MNFPNWTSGTTAKVCYIKEQTILKLTNATGYIRLSNIIFNDGTTLSYTARYTPSSGTAHIDISDLIRIGSGHCTVADNNTTRTIYWTSQAGMNPDTLYIPANQLAAYLVEQELGHYAAPLPSFMILPAGVTIAAEMIVEDPAMYIFKPDTYHLSSNGGVAIGGSYTGYLETIALDVPVVTSRVIQPECGKQYARLTWKSRKGNNKVHYFELSGINYKTSDTLALEPELSSQLSGLKGYREHRGETLSCTLRLDGLTAYDVWYYSDILQSSRCSIGIDNGRVDYAAQCTTAKIEIPDGDAGTNELVLTFNLNSYEHD